ncbi:YALI0C23386p [Yarrowia lipolytica CLIB122]|uniref:Elongator complex protein 2 n=2 Tax=Yarrowia lipolytica TaxID=4952 RepID=Q6CAY3_YARLI|nr:YALI0C23386p [Yarrowia lipolytica CLIB122]AOW03305.1 hypothetical protein YALI1_C32253g [Yarrowia lipolytica]KAB8280311.1 WD40-repeat-containing domain protein [Yarrowia lipolytica]KAE8170240.1 WD40-repeat-containing domain protein [Yarrowia lipolytica]KAJ8053787.1 WD40-repeat-containing domain protein [Yarrowia lipolytica]RMI96234.1 WD40-repeat-containing domain protein [Yarrowia lipolytica]|eukprot:XP_502179.1 YALI0C23386p [Yarrowia lipolytica CLIB122]
MTELIAAGGNIHGNSSDYKDNVLVFGVGRALAFWEPKQAKNISNLLTGHSDNVTAVRFGKDMLLSGAVDGHVLVWKKHGNSWTVGQTLKDHNRAVGDIAVCGDIVATASSDGSVCVYRVKEDLELIQKLEEGPRFMPLCLGITSYEGKQILAVGGTSKLVFIYVMGEDRFSLEASLKGHEDWIRSLDFTIDEGDFLLASASQDKYIRLWRLHFGEGVANRRTADITDPFLTSPLLSNKEYTFEVAGTRATFSFEALVMGHDDWVYQVRWNGLRLLSASADTSLMMWQPDLSSGVWTADARLGEITVKGATTATGSSGGFMTCLWLDDDYVATIGKTGSWRLWKGDERWTSATSITGHFKEATDVCWAKDGSYLLSASHDQTTRIFAPIEGTWREVTRPQIHGYDMICLASIDGDTFVSGADEKILRTFTKPRGVAELLEKLCNISSGDSLPESASMPALGLSNKAVSQDEEPDEGQEREDTVMDASSNIYQVIADLKTAPLEEHLQRRTLWPEVDKLYGHGYEVTCVSASQDSSVIATACRANSSKHAVIRLYETKTWQELANPLEYHQLTVTRTRFSPDDKYLLSVSRDRNWAVWEKTADNYALFSTQEKSPNGHNRIIWDCAWAPLEFGSRVFLTASRDKSLRVWREKEGIWETAATEKFPDAVTACDVLPELENGNLKVIVGLDNGQVYLVTVTKEFQMTSAKQTLHCDKRINRISWQPESNKRYALASADKSVRIACTEQ